MKQDEVELSWEGHSIRRPESVACMPGVIRIIDGSCLILKLPVKGILPYRKMFQCGDFVKDHKINVLVQDEIPASPADYDYTFVWMSDTQYYSASFPYIYDRMTKWIVENKENLKLNMCSIQGI